MKKSQPESPESLAGIYKAYNQGDPYSEWDLTITLTLKDTGRFVWEESFTSYVASYGKYASGHWEADGGAIVLKVGSSTINHFSPGEQISGEEKDGGLCFPSSYRYPDEAYFCRQNAL